MASSVPIVTVAVTATLRAGSTLSTALVAPSASSTHVRDLGHSLGCHLTVHAQSFDRKRQLSPSLTLLMRRPPSSTPQSELHLHSTSRKRLPILSRAVQSPSSSFKLAIIIIVTRILSIFLHRLRQPRVISDILTGIILGPTAMGRVPGFTQAIFPQPSPSYLNLVANLGLILFLFLVGLETDLTVFRKNAKGKLVIAFLSSSALTYSCTVSLSISAIGMVIPFGLGIAVAVGLYDTFIDAETVKKGYFLLFVGVAMAITAFPVLARILTELRLLDDPVGVSVLAAGVGNVRFGPSQSPLAYSFPAGRCWLDPIGTHRSPS